jgi:hypothetical protein
MVKKKQEVSLKRYWAEVNRDPLFLTSYIGYFGAQRLFHDSNYVLLINIKDTIYIH